MNKPVFELRTADVEAVVGTRKSGLKRLLRPFPLLILIVLLAFAGWLLLRPASNGATGGLQYSTRPAEVGSIVVRVTATGTVQPTNKVDISSELSGTMRDVLVDYNSVVKKGDALAVLDQSKLVAAVDSSRARLVSSQAQLRDAQVTLTERESVWNRKRSLTQGNAVSPQDVETAKAAFERAQVAVDTAKANILAAEAQLKLDETNLARSKIVSPIDGIVLMRKVDPGMTVASSLQAPVLFTIAEDLKRMEIQVDVDEADVGGVKDGQTATFSVDAFPNRRFDATIRMVRFGSEVVQGVVTYKAVLTTDNSELLLRPGMTATAEIVAKEVQDALTVPNQALRFSPPPPQEASSQTLLQKLLPGPRPQFRQASAPAAKPGPNRTVYVLRDGQPLAVPVTVGVTDERRTQIVKGDLKAGDRVIIDAARSR